MEFERHKRALRPISMVPLINVVFLLLIFFLVAGTVEKVDVIDVELPEAVSGQLMEEGTIQILLGQYDEVILNDSPHDLYQMQRTLEEALKNNPERLITIKADARMAATRMIDVLDIVKAAGGTNISLTTQPL